MVVFLKQTAAEDDDLMSSWQLVNVQERKTKEKNHLYKQPLNFFNGCSASLEAACKFNFQRFHI